MQVFRLQGHDLGLPAGCILADDMGLGKTLQVKVLSDSVQSFCKATNYQAQAITLVWTLLQSGHPNLGGQPLAKRVIICCPTSLVSNWDNECQKWLKVNAYQFSAHLNRFSPYRSYP